MPEESLTGTQQIEAATTATETVVPASVYAAPGPPASRSKFDPGNYRRFQTTDVGESATKGRKMQTVIPVRKPTKQQFVHAHPSPDYRTDGQSCATILQLLQAL